MNDYNYPPTENELFLEGVLSIYLDGRAKDVVKLLSNENSPLIPLEKKKRVYTFGPKDWSESEGFVLWDIEDKNRTTHYIFDKDYETKWATNIQNKLSIDLGSRLQTGWDNQEMIRQVFDHLDNEGKPHYGIIHNRGYVLFVRGHNPQTGIGLGVIQPHLFINPNQTSEDVVDLQRYYPKNSKKLLFRNQYVYHTGMTPT